MPQLRRDSGYLMRRHLEKEAAEAPIDRVKAFLVGTVSDADSLAEVEADLRSLAATNTRSIHRNLAALENVLEDSALHNELARLVGWHGNWVLEDPSNDGAKRFLQEITVMLRSVLDDAPDRWKGAYDLGLHRES